MSDLPATDELRAILNRLPNKKLLARAFADQRNEADDPAMAALWNWLMAEVAAAEDRERVALADALDGVPLEWRRPDDAPGGDES